MADNEKFEQQRFHDVALFALDNTGVDGKLPRIGQPGAESQEVKEVIEKIAKMTPERKKELTAFFENEIDKTIKHFAKGCNGNH